MALQQISKREILELASDAIGTSVKENTNVWYSANDYTIGDKIELLAGGITGNFKATINGVEQVISGRIINVNGTMVNGKPEIKFLSVLSPIVKGKTDYTVTGLTKVTPKTGVNAGTPKDVVALQAA